MMHRFPRIRLITFLMIAAIPFAAFAAEPVARQIGGGSTMDWQLNRSGHDSAQLRWVGPDGETGSIDFPNGKNVTLQIRDLGTELVDGQYNYELRLVPKVSKDLEKKLQSARSANDDKAARKALKDAGIDPNAGVMSGTFTVQNGAFVSTQGTEGGNAARPTNVSTNAARPSAPIAVNDQVIPDDLIVQMSLCVGFDCVNGESFGFDTIRLKENNTRIKFEDTSSSAGFASTDWQLTANDSASGGANKFSIEDISAARVPFTIEGASTTNSLYVDSTGRIGFRTSTPVLDLHIATSNTPGIRLEQTNAGGFTAQTWDIAGNEANFFVRDVTGGSRLPFRIRPNAPTSSIDISASGNVGIGDASPEANLHVEADSRNPGPGQSAIYVESANNEDAIIGLGAGPSFSDNVDGFLFGYNGNAGVGQAFIGTRPSTGTGQIDFAVKNVVEMRLTATGLEVTDAIRVGGVTMTVPDYVFAEDYELMPLDELKTFIAANKHLPDVPNEAEIKANGLDIAGFQMNLLRKVEELTLYTVAQDETIKQLQARLAELEGQVKK